VTATASGVPDTSRRWLRAVPAVAVLALLLVASVSLASGPSPTTRAVLLAVGGLVAGAVVAFALVRPAVALLLLLAVETTGASGVLGDVHGASAYLVALAVASLALVLGVVRGRVRIRMSPALVLCAVFVATQAPSLAAAPDRSAVWSALLELAKDTWFLVVVVLLATATVSAWTIARVLVSSMAGLSALALANQFVLGNGTDFAGFAVVSDSTGVGAATARHAGPFEDPNFWGRLLVLALPLALALLGRAWRRASAAAVLLWSGSALLLLGALYLTQSRGALLALGVALTVYLVLLGPRARRMVLLLPVAVGLLLLVPGVGPRLASLAEVTAEPTAQVDSSLVERSATQQITLAVFLDHPGVGVGLDNIPAVWRDYSDRSDTTLQQEFAPHNLYLELAAEGGVVGLAGALTFFVGVLLLAFRNLRALPGRRAGPAPPERLLLVGAVAACVGWGVASLFLHLSHLRVLLVAIAIVAVLDQHLARERAQRRQADTTYRSRSPLRVVAAGLTLAVGLAGTAVVAVWVAGDREWAVTVPVTVVPKPLEGDGSYVDPYSHEVLTLPGVMPTYAGAIEQTGLAPALARLPGGVPTTAYRASVTEAHSAAFLVVEVRGPQRRAAVRLAEDIAASGTAYVNRTPALNRLAAARPGEASAIPTRVWSAPWLVAIACGLAAAVGLAVLVLRRARGSGSPGPGRGSA